MKNSIRGPGVGISLGQVNSGGGAAPPATYTFWSVQVVEPQGGVSTICSIGELEMRATVGGADQCMGGTATASSVFMPYDAPSAFDNNTLTRWASQPSQPSRITYQFPAPVSVSQLLIQAPDAGNYASSQMIKSFNLQYSTNGTDWTTALSVTGESTMTALEQRLYAVV